MRDKRKARVRQGQGQGTGGLGPLANRGIYRLFTQPAAHHNIHHLIIIHIRGRERYLEGGEGGRREKRYGEGEFRGMKGGREDEI